MSYNSDLNVKIGGNHYTDVLIPVWTRTDYSLPNFSFSATGAGSTTGQAGHFGIRKTGHLTVTPQTRVDVSGRDQLDGYHCKAELDLYSTDGNSLWNLYQLTQDFVNLSLQNGSGDYYTFIDNNSPTPFGLAGGASGSALMSSSIDYTLTTKDSMCKWTGETFIHPVEWLWILDNATTQVTPNVGSPAVPNPSLSSLSYQLSPATWAVPNSLGISVSGDNFGLFGDDFKLNIKSKEAVKDTRQRPINKAIMVEIDASFLQGRYFDGQAFASKMNNDFTVSLTGWSGIIFNFVNSLSFVGTTDFADSKMEVKGKLKGEIFFDPWGTQTNIAYTNTGKPTFTITRSVYNE